MHYKLDKISGFASREDSRATTRLVRCESKCRLYRKQELHTAQEYFVSFPSETIHSQCPVCIRGTSLCLPAGLCLGFLAFCLVTRGSSSYC